MMYIAMAPDRVTVMSPEHGSDTASLRSVLTRLSQFFDALDAAGPLLLDPVSCIVSCPTSACGSIPGQLLQVASNAVLFLEFRPTHVHHHGTCNSTLCVG